MLAVYAKASDAQAPLSGLVVGDWTAPADRPADQADLVPITVRAATVNPHDLWTLRGAVKPRYGLPSVLGTDAAGVGPDGREYVIHAVLGSADRGGGDETLDPDRTTLADAGHGLLSEQVWIPRDNLVAKPAEIDWAEAACLPTSWLTAYRMLFTRAGLRPGDRLLVQGAGGGVATAAILLGIAAGAEVQVISRTAERRARALAMGAHRVGDPADRLAEVADIVVDTVGPATWSASLAAARPGGAVVTCGASTGFRVEQNLARIFSRQLRIIGSTMGTRYELVALLRFLVATGVRPVIDSVLPLSRAATQLARLESGQAFGKLVVTT